MITPDIDNESNSTDNSKVLCLYHANCVDGLVAAAIVYGQYGEQAEYRAVRYQEPAPVDAMRGRHVYLVDFTYPPEMLMPHLESMLSLSIIDHHHDAMRPWLKYQNVYEKLKVVYDGRFSGASLTWRFFHRRASDTVPLLVRYVQEYDLWTKELPNTDEVQSGLRFRYAPKKANLIELAAYLVHATQDDIDELIKIGSVILQQERAMAQSLTDRLTTVTNLGDFTGIPVCPMPAELVNIAGEILYTKYSDAPFVVLYEDNHKYGHRKYSFRSRRDGGADVSAVASLFGGKGHFNSSGAQVELPARLAHFQVIGG